MKPVTAKVVNLEAERQQREFMRQKALEKDLYKAIGDAEEAEKAEDWASAATHWQQAQILLPANACTRHGIYSKRETVARQKVAFVHPQSHFHGE